MAARTHIIGGGLAGLATAVNLTRAGQNVSLYEGAGHCGGRCRSYFEPALERRIDNGNHLVLSGNRAVREYLGNIGAPDGLIGPKKTTYPFLDLSTAERWTVELDACFIFRAMLSKAGRVPGSSRVDYLKALSLIWASNDSTVADCLGSDNVLFRRLWEPLVTAVLNTDSFEAAASLLKSVISETVGQGAAACRPLMAREGLSETFVDPAVEFLSANRAVISLNTRLRAIRIEKGRVKALEFGSKAVNLAENDSVVLAVPALSAAGLVPGLKVPSESRSIVNGHFKLKKKYKDLSFIGLIGGVAQWLFVRGDIVSVTVSAANSLVEHPAENIARTLWGEVVQALELDVSQIEAQLPPHRIIKEKRATFAQTPEQIKKRPKVRTGYSNLFLAGDWTDTGLPATIEGTIRSGGTASKTVLISSY
jgi:squalene-associated FAD-dependent desaturase